ncbi:GNAT family N-acetyltransferase [uncultured Rhodoblastus sp.]|uniref:GNAT family N-acetyltransferase n=1 Tax=uncultured Rhodoblastus sp. TaxID=543037 RepID=UPI0025FD4275|nr:GNAT family N-acetyltransferase [uncultured Rhodoblastus sp.]
MNNLNISEEIALCVSPPRRADAVVRLDLESLAGIESEWRALEGWATSFCQCYDYARAALSIAEAQGKTSFLVTVRDDDGLRGVWGLTLSRSFHAVLRPFSCGTNEEYSAPLVDSPSIGSRILTAVSTLAGVADRLIIYNTPEDSPFDRAAATLPFPQKITCVPGVVIPSSSYATWGEAEKRLSSGMRYNLRSRAKRLAQRGEVKIGWCDSIGEADRAMAFFFERKALWLKEKGKRSPWVGHSEAPEFFRRLVRATDSPTVAAVQLDGVPVAVAICLVCPRAVEYALTTFDPKYAAYGPAQLLVRFLAQWALEHGRDFDFGITIADYKEQWPVENRTYVSRNVMLTMRGRIPDADELNRSAHTHAVRIKRWIGSRSKTPQQD